MAAWQGATRGEIHEHPFQVYVLTLRPPRGTDEENFERLASFLSEFVKGELKGGELFVGGKFAAEQLDPEKPTVILFQELVQYNSGEFVRTSAQRSMWQIGEELKKLKRPVLFVSFEVGGGSKGNWRGFGSNEWERFSDEHMLNDSTFVQIETHATEENIRYWYPTFYSKSAQWQKRQLEFYLDEENKEAASTIQDWLGQLLNNAGSGHPVDYQHWEEESSEEEDYQIPPWEDGTWGA